MSEQLTKYESPLPVKQVTDKDIEDYLFGTNTKLTDNQKILFSAIAKTFNLNPVLREVYPIPFEKIVQVNGKWTKVVEMAVVTGYQVYLQRAEATGLLNGYSVSIKREGDRIISAKILIGRKDWAIPFEFELNYDEFVKKNKEGEPIGLWRAKPEFMIKKCAIGIGFRLCFPSHLGNMPYLAEEMGSLSFEDIKNRNDDLMKALVENKDVHLMGQKTKIEIFEKANKDKNLVMRALKELGLESEILEEGQKEIIINKIEELQNENNPK